MTLLVSDFFLMVANEVFCGFYTATAQDQNLTICLPHLCFVFCAN